MGISVQSLSPSSVSKYSNCSESFWLDKIEHVRKRGISANMLFGSALHLSIASYYRSLLLQKDAPLDLDCLFRVFRIKFEMVPEDQLFEGSKSREQMYAEAKELLRLFLMEPKVFNPGSIISIEKACSYQMTTALACICQPDLVVRDPDDGVLTIIENKSASKAYSGEDLRRVTEQMSVYSYHYSEPVRLKIHLFLRKKTPEIQQILLDPEIICYRDLVDKFSMVKKAIECGIHFKNHSWMCNSCGLKWCCQPKEEERNEEEQIEREAA